MSRPRALTDPDATRITAEPLAGLQRGRGVARFWGAIPVAILVGLFALRAALHEPPLDRLAPVAAEPGDPPGTTARAGSLWIDRGGPVIIGFQSPRPARLTYSGKELRGAGLIKERIVVTRGAAAIRFAAPPGARLIWNPVGRRGDPEYVSASSLSPEPPERATFERPGTAWLDGAIALGLLLTVVATLCILARRRLAAVSRPAWYAMAVVFAGGLAIRLATLGHAGQTWDEDVNWGAGRNYITNLLGLDFSPGSWTWNYEHPPVMKLLDGIGAQLSDGFGPARVMSAIWIALGCALLVPIGARLYRFSVGVLAAAIAALLPPMLAHGQIVGHESPTVLWWSLGVLLALGVHDYLPTVGRAGVRTLVLRLAGVGVVIGIAIASRFVNGLLGPLCAAIVVIQAPPQWRRATLAWGAVVMPLVAIATVYAVWPRLWGHPIEALTASFKKLDSLHAIEPFLGELTNRPGPHYFVVYLFATLPAGVLAGVVAWAVRAVRERDRAALIVVAWLVIPLVVTASPVRQDGVRYVMPCLLAFAVMAAAGLDGVARLAARRLPAKPVFAALAAAMVAYLAVTAARVQPYYLDYFGEHVGGAATVQRHRWFETAWWGEGLDRAVDYVNQHAAPGAAVYRECIEPAHLAWFRQDLWLPMTRDQRRAAWIVSYAPATKTCPIVPDAKKVFEVTVGGAPLAVVYQRDPQATK